MIDRMISTEATIEKVNALEKAVNERGIYTRRPDMYPFDTVAGEIIAKAFNLTRSALLLVQSGHSDEAFGLCRSLYECAMYLRHITRDLEKRDKLSILFLEFGVKSKSFWFDLLNKNPDLSDESRIDIVRYKQEHQIPDDPKVIFQPWSGTSKLIEKISQAPHPLDPDDSSEDLRNKQRALAYTDTSCYVHCTQPGLNSYQHACREPIRTASHMPSTDTAFKSCLLIQVYLPEITNYCLYGMGLIASNQLGFDTEP
jgi:hypothetical protein